MRFFSAIVSLFFFTCFAVAAIVFVVILRYSMDLPDYRTLSDYHPQITSRLYAADGSLLAEYATEKRIFVPVDKIPPMLRAAFIAAEDKTFYTHGGIDFMGIARAVLVNLQNVGRGRRKVGASTITQQVAKNFLLTSEQSFSRKIKEILLARKMEQTFTKDHILELYLNEIYLGVGSYGVASAALNYFDKSMSELTIGEMAFLAALPKGPNNYHPVRKPQAALERRNWVLKRMAEEGYITPEIMADAMKEPIKMTPRHSDMMNEAGYYAEEVRRFVVGRYGEQAIYNGGLFIRTSLDPRLQRAATRALQDGLMTYDKRHGWRGPVRHFDTGDAAKAFLTTEKDPLYLPEKWRMAAVMGLTQTTAEIVLADGTQGTIALADLAWARQALPEGRISVKKVQVPADVLAVGDVIYVQAKKEPGQYMLRQMPVVEGALVALDPHTGRVLAMSGGFSFWKNQFNRAIQAYRQPGSSFKPFVYLAALDAGYTPSSLILDAPLVMENPDGTKWKPKNYSQVFYGPTTLRVGIEKSRNLMTIRLAQAIGMQRVLEYGKKFGISDKLEPVLSTALGAGETTLMRLTTAYGMLVNGGKKISPSLIDRIQDRDGITIYKYDERPCDKCTGPDASPDERPVIPDTREQIQDSASAYQMVNILAGVVERGTGRVASSLHKTLGAKSGTSNDSLDAWFIGFSPDLVVGVWVGFDTPQTLGPNDTGGVVSGPIFRDFMRVALENKPDIPFRVPDTVQLVRVNATTGRPATAGDTNVIMEAFRKGTDLTAPVQVVGGRNIIVQEDNDMPALGDVY